MNARRVLAAALDVALVLIARASHREHLDVAGDADTAWPFLAGLAAG